MQLLKNICRYGSGAECDSRIYDWLLLQELNHRKEEAFTGMVSDHTRWMIFCSGQHLQGGRRWGWHAKNIQDLCICTRSLAGFWKASMHGNEDRGEKELCTKTTGKTYRHLNWSLFKLKENPFLILLPLKGLLAHVCLTRITYSTEMIGIDW